MNVPLVFHEDTFHAFFKPVACLGRERNCWGGVGIETYGEDLALASKADPNKVWTVVDGDAGSDQWIVPGMHYVNRVCYLITETPHDGAELVFRAQSSARSLTPLGLTRQLRKLEKYLALEFGALYAV